MTFEEEESAGLRRQYLRHALRLTLVFALLIGGVFFAFWWSGSAIQFGAARAAGRAVPTWRITGVVRSRGQLTLIGLPLFLYFSTRLFGGLRAALNEVFDTEERRSWQVGKLIDLALVLLTGTLLLLSALLPAIEARTTGMMPEGDNFLLEWLYRLSLEIVAFGFSTVLFLAVFKVLPSRRIAWRTAFVAAVFCALAFELAKRLYALYVSHFVTLDRLASNANAGAFLLLILWIYYTNFVLLIGGEIAEAYDLARMRRAQRVHLG